MLLTCADGTVFHGDKTALLATLVLLLVVRTTVGPRVVVYSTTSCY